MKKTEMTKAAKPFMEWLDDKVDEWGIEKEVEEAFNKLMLQQLISEMRERAGLTQAQLARRTGVSQPMIARLESGRVGNITFKTLIRTSIALGYRPRIDFEPLRKSLRVSKSAHHTALPKKPARSRQHATA